MTSKVFILWSVLFMTGILAACTDSDSPAGEQNSEKKVTIRATIEGDFKSRVALEDHSENQVVKVDWEQGDAFKMKVDGITYTFTYVEDNKFECSSAYSFPTTFKNTETITVTYSAVSSTDVYQSGTLEGAASLLSMTATLDVKANQSTADLALNFKHENSIVKLTLNNDDFKVNPVTCVILKSGSSVIATSNETFFGDVANGNIVAYFAVNPQEMTDVSVLAISKNNNYTATLEDYTLKAGELYLINEQVTFTKPMGDITAAKAVMGDYAMADGTFISGSATLTDEEKANVAGIVFWTAKQPTEATLTPAKLTDDAIMAKDFPDCTHGLIVSLRNVSDSIKWQEKYTYISDWQVNTFDAEDKGSYKSIASLSSTDNPASELINYILGYQNTKLLKAYNASLPSGSANTVLPVSLLETFSAENPAPAKTTGWFIPSGKELVLLRGKDVDNVYRNKSIGSDTKNTINERLKNLGPDWADVLGGIFCGYWTSTEDVPPLSNAFYGIFDDGFNRGVLGAMIKDKNPDHVRAVCAY